MAPGKACPHEHGQKTKIVLLIARFHEKRSVAVFRHFEGPTDREATKYDGTPTLIMANRVLVGRWEENPAELQTVIYLQIVKHVMPTLEKKKRQKRGGNRNRDVR